MAKNIPFLNGIDVKGELIINPSHDNTITKILAIDDNGKVFYTSGSTGGGTTDLSNYYTKPQADSKFITSLTDTLQNVTARGATSDKAVNFTGSLQIPNTATIANNAIWLSDVIGSTGYTAPVVSSLSTLTDVGLSSLANGQALVYNSASGKWTNQNIVTDLSAYYLASNPAGYITAASLQWTNITGKPTTVLGYGITDGTIAPLAIPDNAVVRGDGGGKGVQSSGVIIDDSNNLTMGKLLFINAPSGNPEFDFQVAGVTKSKTYWDNTAGRLVFQNNANNNQDAIYFTDHITTSGNLTLGANLSAVNITASGIANFNGSTSLIIPTGSTTTANAIWLSDTVGSTGYTAPIVSSLSTLTDVGLSSLANGQALTYNSTTGKWTNQNIVTDLSVYFNKTESDLRFLGINNNAVSASKLFTARLINGVSFDGSANITIADNTKAPLTGGGTSGTWGISITGNAATATTTGNWGGNQLGGASSSAPNYLFGAYAGGNAYYSDATAVKSFLGLGTMAYQPSTAYVGVGGGGDAISGIGSSTFDSTNRGGQSGFAINNHTGVSVSSHPSYGGFQVYNSGYPNITPATLLMKVNNGLTNIYGSLDVSGRADAGGFLLKGNNTNLQFEGAASADLMFSAIPNTRVLQLRNGNATSPNYNACGFVTGSGVFSNTLQVGGTYQQGDFDAGTTLNITNSAYIYGRATLRITGRLDNSNDAWSLTGRANINFARNSGGSFGSIGEERFAMQYNMLYDELGVVTANNTVAFKVYQNGCTSFTNIIIPVSQPAGLVNGSIWIQ